MTTKSLPVSILLGQANEHDSRKLIPLVERMRLRKPKGALRRQGVRHVHRKMVSAEKKNQGADSKERQEKTSRKTAYI